MKRKTKEFYLKVLRNGLILSGMQFASVFAIGEISYIAIRPIIAFFMAYVAWELKNYHKIEIPKTKKRTTLVFA